jgi:hypothetical protein
VPNLYQPPPSRAVFLTGGEGGSLTRKPWVLDGNHKISRAAFAHRHLHTRLPCVRLHFTATPRVGFSTLIEFCERNLRCLAASPPVHNVRVTAATSSRVNGCSPVCRLLAHASWRPQYPLPTTTMHLAIPSGHRKRPGAEVRHENVQKTNVPFAGS